MRTTAHRSTPGARARGHLAALAVAATVLAGCSQGSAPSSAASPGATAPAGPASVGPTGSPSPGVTVTAPSAWDLELASVGGDGTRSLDSALRLMAMAFGPIPGVTAAPAVPGTVGSASPAVRVVRAHLDDLDPRQRAAVEAYLAVPDDAPVLDLAAGIDPSRAAADDPLRGLLAFDGPVTAVEYPYSEFEREVVEDGQRARAHAATYLGDLPELRIRTTSAPGEPFVTFFNPTITSGVVTACDVIVNRATANVDRFATRRAISLDVVHCLQSGAMGSEAGFMGEVPGWAWEGPAEYLVLEMWPLTTADAQAWLVYLTNPEDSLFIRTYDAIGFYAQAFEGGVDLAAAFRAVLTDVDDPERFALAGATSNRFLDEWASGLARRPWGPAWDFSGPGIPYPDQGRTPGESVAVSNGSTDAFSQDAYGNRLVAMRSTADIVFVQANGRVRVGDGSTDEAVRGVAIYCTTERGCGPCPDGQRPSVTPTRLGPDALLAVGGGTDGTTGAVSGHPLEEFCTQTPPPSADDGGEFCRRWRSYIEWAMEQGEADIDRTLAAAIVMQFEGMRPVAPPAMVPHVEVIIETYRRFATAPDPVQVPLAGQTATQMYEGLLAIDAHCRTGVFQ